MFVLIFQQAKKIIKKAGDFHVGQTKMSSKEAKKDDGAFDSGGQINTSTW